MKLAIINSNNLSIKSDTPKGTEIFSYILIKNLIKHEGGNLKITAFTSGNSDLPVKIESIDYLPSSSDTSLPANKHVVFELALIAEAFAREDEFDLFHINIGDGDIALPFTRFIKKPVLITLHNTQNLAYVKKYFSLFKDLKHVYFVSISNFQRRYFPQLNYINTIYHGIDIENNFTFNAQGGDAIMWAGRAIPKKGMDTVIKLARSQNKKAKLFAIAKRDHYSWFQQQINNVLRKPPPSKITINKEIPRLALVPQYQTSKVFIFPITWEEPFGLVTIEAMACGTPVIAYARGSMPEIIKDGETGFLVNPSDDDIRGDWIVKKTGIDGLKEAVERIYTLSDTEYLVMRQNCRRHVENNFTIKHMIDNYIKVYKQITTNI